jgi:serine/threonine protein kinase
VKSKLVSENSLNLARREALIHAKIPPHPHIVKLLYSEEDENRFALVIERASHGDYLEKKLQNVRKTFGYL